MKQSQQWNNHPNQPTSLAFLPFLGIISLPYTTSMQELLNAIFYQPIFNAFIALYHLIPDIGIVIVVLTIIIKFLLYPFNAAAIKAQKSMADLQPHMAEIKEKYKGNQQKIAEETMKLYQANKVNPFGSCLPLIIQLVITIALYYVLRNGLAAGTVDGGVLYSFVSNPGTINTTSLGLFDLHQSGNIVLAGLAGIAQYFQARMMIRKRPPQPVAAGAKDEDMMAMMNKQMLYFLPFMTVIIGFQLPSGLALYWLVSTLFTLVQQYIVFRKHEPPTAPDASVTSTPA